MSNLGYTLLVSCWVSNFLTKKIKKIYIPCASIEEFTIKRFVEIELLYLSRCVNLGAPIFIFKLMIYSIYLGRLFRTLVDIEIMDSKYSRVEN